MQYLVCFQRSPHICKVRQLIITANNCFFLVGCGGGRYWMDKEVKLIFPSYVDTPFLHYILLWGSKSHIKVSCSRIFKIKLSRHF